jgi:hypothetical protein
MKVMVLLSRILVGMEQQYVYNAQANSAAKNRLIAINAVSLVFALIANFALLLNMARRLPFAIAQSITIVGWLLSSFLLIALVAVASSNASHDYHCYWSLERSL